MNDRTAKKQKPAASFSRAAAAKDRLMSEANPLVVATLDILDETLRGSIPDGGYQSIVLANSLLPLKNKHDLIEEGDYGDAVRILKSFALLRDSEDTETHLEKASTFPPAAKSLFVARAAATVENATKAVQAGEESASGIPSLEFLKEYAHGLSRLLNSGGLDNSLGARMASAFSNLAAAIGSDMEMRQDVVRGVFHVGTHDPADVTQNWSAGRQAAPQRMLQ